MHTTTQPALQVVFIVAGCRWSCCYDYETERCRDRLVGSEGTAAKTKTQETVWMTAAGSRKRKWRRKNAPELQAKTAPQFFFFFERCRLWLRPNYEEIPAELTFRAFSRPKWRGCSPFFHVLQHPTLQIRLRAFPVWPGGGNGRRKPAQKRGATWPRPAPLGG